MENVPLTTKLRKGLSDLDKMNLYGRIMSLREVSYMDIENKAGDKKGKRERVDRSESNYQLTFNRKGNVIEKTIFNLVNSIWRKFNYDYDSRGNRTKEIHSNADGSILKKCIIKYDRNSIKIEEINSVQNQNLWWKSIYMHDSKGDITEEIRSNLDGSIFGKSVFKYDGHGNMLEESRYNPNGNISKTITYEYDELGYYREKHSIFQSDGKIENCWSSVYDNRGNITEDSSSGTEYEYEYDEKGNIDVITYSTEVGDYEVSYMYEYDNFGNWTTKTEYSESILQCFNPINERYRVADGLPIIFEREIKYYASTKFHWWNIWS